jgi:serine/alanine adding enzyme
MNYKISEMKIEDKHRWDSYVDAHPKSNIYQYSGWKSIIENTYGHKTFYLQAVGEEIDERSASSQFAESVSKSDDLADRKGLATDSPGSNDFSIRDRDRHTNRIVGILPLVHIKHFLFGNSLISIPYCDLGGVLADNEEIERDLVFEAVEFGKRLDASNIEIRNLKTLRNTISRIGERDGRKNDLLWAKWRSQKWSRKVRMLMELPDSSSKLMESFKSKLRSQIRKPVKEGVETRIGGTELLNDFYHVFAINMKDLGSPVHSRHLFFNLLKVFPDKSKIAVAYYGKKPVAGSIMLLFRDTVMNPWASFLKSYKKMSPNMLLYWSMLAYACDNGFKYFDFGRCTPGGGTFKFKEQWGASPENLEYSYFSDNGSFDDTPISEKKMFKIGSEVWKKLPVMSTRIFGPAFRKYIGL